MTTVLKQERLRQGWTQEHVADRVGITPEAIGMIENGKRNPSYPVLVKLESLFGLPHGQLFAPAEESA